MRPLRYSPKGCLPSRRRARRLAAILERLPVLPGVEDFAGRAALEFADDAVLGHEVDQAGGAAVADAQGALQERAGAAALADDDLNGRLVQLVALLQGRAPVLAPRTAVDLELDQLAAELDGVALEELADAVDLGIRDIGPLGAD